MPDFISHTKNSDLRIAIMIIAIVIVTLRIVRNKSNDNSSSYHSSDRLYHLPDRTLRLEKASKIKIFSRNT